MWKAIFKFGLLILISSQGSFGVVITTLKVPPTYTIESNTRTEPLVLDCEYEVEPTETGLVLKWLLNNNQIYQWIPNHKPFPMGFMKSRIDTSFSVSSDRQHRHRAVSIIKPDWNMTGEYTCSIQSFQSADRKTAHLQIIVPESDFHLNAKVDLEADDVIIICSVQNVFPEPVLTVMFNNDKPLQVIKNIRRSSNNLFTGNVSVEIPRNEVESPTPINCILTLPGTNYTKRRETIFYDQGLTTTVEPNEEEISSAISRLEGESSKGGAVNLAMSFPFLSIIFQFLLFS